MRGQLDLPRRAAGSFALVDRTSLYRTSKLLQGDGVPIDPFLGLADLGTVVGALLFDDTVVVLGDHETAALASFASELLGLEEPIRALSFDPDIEGDPNITGSLSDAETTLASLVDSLVGRAKGELDSASAANAPWMGRLRAHWESLLPGLNRFPPHHGEFLHAVAEKYDGQTFDGYDLFNVEGDAWAFSSYDLDEIIVDNDLRALFYEQLCASLQLLLDESGRRPLFRYAGGCLRAPMQLARAGYARDLNADNRSGEAWLQEQWIALESRRGEPLRLPFWLEAVLARCDQRSDFGPAVADIRRAARGFRARRGEITKALRYGETAELEKLEFALRGDVRNLTASMTGGLRLALAPVNAAIRVFLPAAASETVSALGDSAVAPLAARMVRPDLRAILQVSEGARRYQRPLRRAAELFAWPRAELGEEARHFVEGLGTVAWIA
jgi:hypothetical protein